MRLAANCLDALRQGLGVNLGQRSLVLPLLGVERAGSRAGFEGLLSQNPGSCFHFSAMGDKPKELAGQGGVVFHAVSYTHGT